jgi:hypothetical protein
MSFRVIASLVVLGCLAPAVIIDRIAVIVGNSIVKESDVKRDIRVTSFLDNETPDLSLPAQRKALNRLIDQVFIRREIDLGNYPTATLQQADQQLERIKKERFRTEGVFNQALRKYDLSALDLRTQFQWQLTVLRFIDIRFKPAVLITGDEIEKYYRDHAAALRRQYPGKSSLAELRSQIRQTLIDERVNQQFFAWLDEQRRETKVQFREESLQ